MSEFWKLKKKITCFKANDEKKISKIFTTNADCVILDIEDGVALNRKQQARENIRKLYETDERVQTNLKNKYTVRINAPASNEAKQDILYLFENKKVPKTLFVPKTNSSDDIKWLFDQLNVQIEASNSQIDKLSLFFYMESASSLVNLKEIIETALNLSNTKYKSRFHLEGFVFGSDDFCADINAVRTNDAYELIYARQKLITYCKAFRLKAIDMVYISFKDLNGLKLQSEQGFRMGFTGKQVIHPLQVDIVQEAFSPSEEKIKWAIGLVLDFL